MSELDIEKLEEYSEPLSEDEIQKRKDALIGNLSQLNERVGGDPAVEAMIAKIESLTKQALSPPKSSSKTNDQDGVIAPQQKE